MKQLSRTYAFCVMLFLILTTNLSTAQPVDIDWTLLKQFQLTDRPLDIAISGDGQLLFILTPGKVAVYPGLVDVPLKQIPLDAGFDRMTYYEKTNVLILTNGTTNAVSVLEIDLVQKIAVEGSPFKGPEDATVVLAVFDDYQ